MCSTGIYIRQHTITSTGSDSNHRQHTGVDHPMGGTQHRQSSCHSQSAQTLGETQYTAPKMVSAMYRTLYASSTNRSTRLSFFLFQHRLPPVALVLLDAVSQWTALSLSPECTPRAGIPFHSTPTGELPYPPVALSAYAWQQTPFTVHWLDRYQVLYTNIWSWQLQ